MVRSPSGMNDDGPRAFLDRLRVDAVGQPFLDDDGVSEITFGLREQVADGHGFACVEVEDDCLHASVASTSAVCAWSVLSVSMCS